MPLCLPSSALITCSVSPAPLRTPPLPAPRPPSTALANLNTTDALSLTCALQCPHFQSYAPFVNALFPLLLYIFFKHFNMLYKLISFSVFIVSCSGCTQEFNLHRPIIVDEATDFFKNLGVPDFTFDSCRLVFTIYLVITTGRF